ncbi:MAG: flagellin [Campylobacterota bacterium]|nr:flagellin [Campylobacterota bacterium]
MGFRINTNIAAMNAHTNSVMNNRKMDESLARLSSGLRITKAADDASGMVIADSLRSQASSLAQAVSNGNDAIGLLQTADGALDEYGKILDTIKSKSIQAASDGQNTSSRLAIQKDIDALMEELNIIAKTTSFNGQKLLSGTFTNKEFQVGASANESVKVSIASAQTNQIGQTSRADLALASDMGGEVSLTMKSATTGKELTLKTIDVQYDNNYQNSMGALSDEINKYSGDTGISAKAIVTSSSDVAVSAGSTGSDFAINGVTIGAVNVADNDNDGTLLNAINSKTTQTGVSAALSTDGKLTLESDGKSILVEGSISDVVGATASSLTTVGYIELVQSGSAEFQIEGIGAGATGGNINIDAKTTMVKDSILAAGSTIGAASSFVAGSSIGGDANLLTSILTSQLDSSLKAGSTIETASILKAGTETGGSFVVGSTTAGGDADVALDKDMLVATGSTLKSGSILGQGSVVTTGFTVGTTTYNVGDTLSNDVTLDADLTLTADMTLKDDTNASSSIKQLSTINTGSILGADFTVGLQVTTNATDGGAAGATVGAGTTASVADMYVHTDANLALTSTGLTFVVEEGSILSSGSILQIDGATSGWVGPDLVTAEYGVLKQGDVFSAVTGSAEAVAMTLDGDLKLDADLTLTGYSNNNLAGSTINSGSLIKAGSVGAGDAAVGFDTISELSHMTGSTNMTLADDMTVKAGSSLEAGSILLSGSVTGDKTYVFGTGTNDALSTYAQSDVKAGSVLEGDTIFASGSTIGGTITTSAKETLTSDMSLKAGSTLQFVSGADNTMFKAGTIFNQDITLNTSNAGGTNFEVSVKAGDVLTSDLFLDDAVDPVTLAKDMMMLDKSVIAAGSTLAVNTENAGTVGLSNEEFTNLDSIDVTTLDGAMKAIDTLGAAINNLDTIRSGLGSAQNQLVSTINNISVTQVNVKAAESNIRDVDFAAESANFSKLNILAQSGSYAMSQANAVQQNVLRLLQ